MTTFSAYAEFLCLELSLIQPKLAKIHLLRYNPSNKIMDALQTLIATSVAALISSAITILLTKIIEMKHARDLESYKSQLQLQHDRSKAELENEWQMKFFEYQTKFSSLHQQQAQAIGEIYGMLADTHQYIIRLIHPIQTGDDMEQMKELTADKYQALAAFYTRNRIYLNEDVCEKIDSVLQRINVAFFKWEFAQSRLYGEGSLESWNEAWQSVSNEVPPILKELEKQFRRALSP